MRENDISGFVYMYDAVQCIAPDLFWAAVILVVISAYPVACELRWLCIV